MSRTKGIFAAIGVAAVSMTLLPFTANASAPDIQADVDGDKHPDNVSLRQVSEDTMLLRVGLRDGFVDAKVTGDSQGQEPRVVDVNGDGLDEIMVPESVGANTITYTVWGYGEGLYQVRMENGDPWRLAEGGGASAVSAYECAPASPARELVTVSATQQPTENGYVYRGNRDTYSVRDGEAKLVNEVPVEAPHRDAPQLAADPATCAPLH